MPVGNAAGDAISSWLNPTSLLIGVLAVLTGAYLSAVFMAGDSVRAEPARPGRRPSARARSAPAPSPASSPLGGLLVLGSDAPDSTTA